MFVCVCVSVCACVYICVSICEDIINKTHEIKLGIKCSAFQFVCMHTIDIVDRRVTIYMHLVSACQR